MARLRYNGLTATLGAALTAGDTTITFAAALTSAAGAVPTISGSNIIPLTILNATGGVSEIVSLTAYTSGATTGTIARAQEGTTASAHASGDEVIHSATVADFPSSSSGPLLSRTTYSAGGTVTSIITTSATLVDADATNLAITFTVPASGTVRVSLEALGGGTGAVVAHWGLREGTTTLQETQVYNNLNSAFIRTNVNFIVTGLTPGASKTYKWGHCKAAGTDSRIFTGGTAGMAIMSAYDASLT